MKFILGKKFFLQNQIAISRLKEHPLVGPDDLKKLDQRVTLKQIMRTLGEGHTMPIYIRGDQLVGCFQRGHEEDTSLVPEILIENLAADHTP